jgi:hypothetical protein
MCWKLLFAATTLTLGTAAQAAPIVVGQWYNFEFGIVGSALGAGGAGGISANPASLIAPAGPWTFSLASGGTLTVVDGFNSGDQFTMSDFGSTIGITSAPGASSCFNDITACLANAAMSKGTFALGAGAHSITGVATLSPFNSGAGYFIVRNVAGAVPEAASWAMMLVGFGVVGGAFRYRRNKMRVSMTMI